MKTLLLRLFRFFSIIFFCVACSDSFLDERPNSNILTPGTPDDFQRLLDNFEEIGILSSLPQLSSDEYFIETKPDWLAARTAVEKSAYIWDADVFGGETNIDDWNAPYQTIFYTNNIIHEINEITNGLTIPSEYHDVYGQALFHRAFAYYDLILNYSPVFDSRTQDTDLGVPLRLDPSIDYTASRASIRECYNQVFTDLESAKQFLQFEKPLPQRNRPTKVAVSALLARIYLSRREYMEAEKHCNDALAIYDRLIDYNTLSFSDNAPFSRTNEELILFAQGTKYSNSNYRNSSQSVFVDTALIELYHPEDLRLTLYFIHFRDNRYTVKTGYHGVGLTPFLGLAVDELYLIKAECQARRADIAGVRSSLDQLLHNRYKTGTYPSTKFSNSADALETVLLERRKELVWRASRWQDIKRLNKEGAEIVLTRKLENTHYTLSPGATRYVFNIPQDEINRSGIKQNIR